MVAIARAVTPTLIMHNAKDLGPKKRWGGRSTRLVCTRYSKNLYIVNPNLIREVDVLIHAMSVRSCAKKVRRRAKSSVAIRGGLSLHHWNRLKNVFKHTARATPSYHLKALSISRSTRNPENFREITASFSSRGDVWLLKSFA